MKRLLGYKNVRICEGAMQEGTLDPNAPAGVNQPIKQLNVQVICRHYKTNPK